MNIKKLLRSLKDFSFGSVLDSTILQFYRKYPSMLKIIGGGEPSYTNRIITETLAFNTSLVYACTRVISDPVGMLPLNLIQETGEAEVVVRKDKSLHRLLHYSPNGFQPAITFRQTMQMNALNWGNAYAVITRRSGAGPGGSSDDILSLRHVDPDRVGVILNPDENDFHYRIQTRNGFKNVDRRDMFHLPGLGFDGVIGQSVISWAKNTIGLDQAALEYGGRFFARGGRVPYILKHPGKWKTDSEFELWREEWEKIYSDPHRAPILRGGVEYQQIGFKPEDSQLLSTRKFSEQEIPRWYVVNPYKVGASDRLLLNNIEMLGIEFVQSTLGYWVGLWQQMIWLKLLGDKEKDQGFGAAFELDSLLQGGFEDRMKGWAIALQNGVANPDTVAIREKLPKLPNGAGRAYHIQLNMQTLPGTGEPTAIEAATLARSQPSKGA